MTAQTPERLLYQGKELDMCDQPLHFYFDVSGHQPRFEFCSTALLRGYVGLWEIIGERLYLIGLEGWLKDGGTASVASVFPDHPDRVFAHWVNGTIRIPQGRLLEYVHMGYGSMYEQDLLLTFRRGVLVGSEVRHNGTAEPEDGHEGYAIHGALVVRPAAADDGAVS